MGLFESYQFVFLGTETEGFGCIDGVGAVAGIDAFDKVGFSFVGRIDNHIYAGSVEGDRVGGSKYAEVGHLWSLWIAVAVAVYRQIVGYVDV